MTWSRGTDGAGRSSAGDHIRQRDGGSVVRSMSRPAQDGANCPSPCTAAADSVHNRLVDTRQRGARRHVQMLETFPDRPRVRARPPMELLVIERPDKRVSVCRELFELTAEIVEGRCQRKGHGRRGWHAREGRDGGVDPVAGQGRGLQTKGFGRRWSSHSRNRVKSGLGATPSGQGRTAPGTRLVTPTPLPTLEEVVRP